MSDVERTPLLELEAPYRRAVKLDHVLFDSGMEMLRVVIREGHRITQLDLDPATARAWGAAMVGWAEKVEAGEPVAPAS